MQFLPRAPCRVLGQLTGVNKQAALLRVPRSLFSHGNFASLNNNLMWPEIEKLTFSDNFQTSRLKPHEAMQNWLHKLGTPLTGAEQIQTQKRRSYRKIVEHMKRADIKPVMSWRTFVDLWYARRQTIKAAHMQAVQELIQKPVVKEAQNEFKQLQETIRDLEATARVENSLVARKTLHALGLVCRVISKTAPWISDDRGGRS